MPDDPETPSDPAESGEGKADLPGSNGKTFASLDEYLGHLELGGHIDKPFWERMKDGTYRWNTGRGMGLREVETATRAELLEKYGFSE